MPNIFATSALLLLTALPTARADTIRISLFSLLKPQMLNARIASGDGARLDTIGLNGSRRLAPGEIVRLRLAGSLLNVTVTDSLGRVKLSLTAAEARIIPDGLTAIELSVPGKITRVVRGEAFIAPNDRRPRGPLNIVLATDRESVVTSVVAAELSGQRAVESFKALAVVARTYMLSHAGRHAEEGFDFCDTTHCQFYRGEQDLSPQAASPVVASAVAETEGEHLSFQGKPVACYYTAVCGGLTATPEMAWGGGDDDGYAHQRVTCRWCKLAHNAKWERAARAAEVLDALSAEAGFRLSHAADIRVESDTQDGFVRAVIIRDSGRRATLTADEFRRAIGRRLGWSTVLSPTFTVERRGHRMIFRGGGFGSQVGLCLAGAVAQAKAGRSYKEILNLYFPQAEIKGRSTNE
jgi:stage II sporulation protein D